MTRFPFSMSLLALAVGSSAQAETNVMEESIVVGTRASLMSAVDKQELADKLISIALRQVAKRSFFLLLQSCGGQAVVFHRLLSYQKHEMSKFT